MTNEADDTQDRMALSQALWDLRCAIARHGDADANRVSFGRMLTDPAYRARVIGGARQSANTEVRGLADEAARHNTGRLAETPVSWESAGRTELDIDALNLDGARRPRHGKHVSMMGAASALLLSALAGLLLSYVGNAPLAQLLAGREHVGGEIVADTTWRGERTYVLEDKVFVTDGATLTIEPGARVVGEPGTALVVTRDAELRAEGDRDNPIVFTSARPEGQRARGDWGGVVLLGDAPVNTDEPHIEGIAADDPRGGFGGRDASGSCGVLAYARIEFAGHELARNVELNGLTLGGCGAATVVRHVQVHMGLDDGIELFGGRANLERVAITRPGDDGLDWDLGWQGNAQHVLVQMGPDAGDNAIEADNNRADHGARPRSSPTLANVTLLGSRERGTGQRGLTLRRGTAADLRNLVVAGFPLELIDIRDRATADLVAAGRLRLSGLIGHEIGPDGERWAESEEGEADDDGGFDEGRFLRRSSHRLGSDPGLARAAFDLDDPNFHPAAGSPVAQAAADVPQGEFWREGARYLGAFRPGAVSSWLNGWAAFPAR